MGSIPSPELGVLVCSESSDKKIVLVALLNEFNGFNRLNGPCKNKVVVHFVCPIEKKMHKNIVHKQASELLPR